VLRPLAAAVLTTACLAVVAPSASAGSRGAGSAADYEFMTDAGTAAATQPSASGECTLHGPYADACVDGSACWINDPAAVQDPAELTTRRPRQGDHVVFMSCLTPSGDQWSRWYWSSQDPEVGEG